MICCLLFLLIQIQHTALQKVVLRVAHNLYLFVRLFPHLYGDVERDVKLEDRTFLDFACGCSCIPIIFCLGYFFTKNHEYGNALICISLVPLCFFLYKSQLKTDIGFHLLYSMIGGLANIGNIFLEKIVLFFFPVKN